MAYHLGSTPQGKEIEAFMQEDRALYRIRFKSGGELPQELKGEYTSVEPAQKDVNFYLSKKPAKKVA